MASSSASFQYTPLEQDQPDAFRLLILIPGNEDDLVSCKLTSHRRRVEKPSYRALSYAWGDIPPTMLIYVNGIEFWVTPNLYAALEVLRGKPGTQARSQILWIDFICINQADVLERNGQVGQMQEIYADAEEVLVWLGPATRNSALAFDFIGEICKHLKLFGIKTGDDINVSDYTWGHVEDGIDKYLGNDFQERWKAVAEILLRPWWKRAWIIQELASARSAEIYCGEAHIPCVLLALVIRILYTQHPKLLNMPASDGFYDREDDMINRAFNLNLLRYHFQTHGAVDLYFVVSHSRRYRCRDPRDKVYSVLGLAAPDARKMIIPDYNKSVSSTYGMVVMTFVSVYESLDILRLIEDGTKNLSCPSWAVDLSLEIPHAGLEAVSFDNSMPFNSCALLSTAAFFSGDLEAMFVDGFCIDVVEDGKLQGDRDVFTLNTATRKKHWQIDRMIWKLQDSGGVQNAYDSKSTTSVDKLRQEVEGALFDVATAGHFFNYEASEYQPQKIVYPETNSRTGKVPLSRPVKPPLRPVNDQPTQPVSWAEVAGRAEMRKSGRKFLGKGPLPQTAKDPPSRPVNWEELEGQAEMWTWRRTLILTKKHYLGLAPASTNSGDHIFILFGYWMPVVLRPKHDDTWSFVGSVYIPGFMKGEAAAGLDSGLYTKQIVELR